MFVPLFTAVLIGLLLAYLLAAEAEPEADSPPPPPLRPPAVPLVTHDPYLSVWSCADRLTDDVTRHWTGAPHALRGFARIDGQVWRFAGAEPSGVPVMEQTGLDVTLTRTTYRFGAGGVRVELECLSPVLANDLDLTGRPVTYLTVRAASADGAQHEVQVALDVAAAWSVDHPAQDVEWGRCALGEVEAVRAGARDQRVLGRAGDDLRIEWGWLYLAARRAPGVSLAACSARAALEAFQASGRAPESDDLNMPRRARADTPVLACAFNFGRIGADAAESWAMVAYDDVWCMELMDRRLRPYWRRDGSGPGELLRTAASERDAVRARCATFDEELGADLRAAGGERYARIATLAYRQCMAAHKLAADFDGSPLHFSKENFSNGCTGTVDVIYPAAPLFLLLSPRLVRAQLAPVLDYASSARWPWPFAPHDLGTYPLANGQAYGGGERTEENQMPVEESGNMLILLAALAKAEGSPDFALRWWSTLERWAAYLREKGMDPENQLCTDDFAGHLAHNVNLSAKAIVALGAFGMLCEMAGRRDDAAAYRDLAAGMASRWVETARDGERTLLAFDRPGTWSQKYNLVWDRILGLGLFPPEVTRREVVAYSSLQNRYGLPLDSRKDYTKTDWVVWSATLAESRQDFEALIGPLHDFAQETPDRVPLTDWYDTKDARKVGFQARSVVGGVFIKLLADADMWRKWRERAI
ncbi:MAG TPA: DUF4965 domain-containing protein [Chthonomonadales bacterium]|nr:DUF4965 domain-containing protein [Chthonomonadales bacterium]